MKVLMVYGTRPEAIKMAPLAQRLGIDDQIELKICVTGQHREMLDQVNALFKIVPDYDLNVMQIDQSLNQLIARVVSQLDPVIEEVRPTWILVHGDTSTAMAAALCAFHRRVSVAHVEAGLRTNDLALPWPEELNRQVIDVFAEKMFAPTNVAAANICHTGNRQVFVTGNTVIDALFWVKQQLQIDYQLAAKARLLLPILDPKRKTILVTGHRRESFGEGFLSICEAVLRLAKRHDVQVVYPVHLNPNVREPVNRLLGGHPNIHLTSPLDYVPFVLAMMESWLILTDSGGVQEEAPSLGKPVLVMRDVTERPEAVSAGTVQLVGTNVETICIAATRLLDDEEYYARFARAHNPYGDGRAVERIVAALKGDAIEQFLPPSRDKLVLS